MNNKILNILSGVALIAIIGVMSWRDMHPKIDTTAAPRLGVLSYYAGDGVTLDMIPDNGWPITVGVGSLSYAPDDKLLWTPHGMPPVTIAQRQINLQFYFGKNLPKNPDETIEKIKSIADEWTHKGNGVSIIVLDYSPAEPDLKAYVALAKAARNAFKEKYIAFAGINALWPEGPQKASLEDLQKESPRFLIHLPQASIVPQFLAQLAALRYNFILQYPEGTRLEDIDANSLKTLPRLTGVTLGLDPHKPLPKKEEKIGLFPKL